MNHQTFLRLSILSAFLFALNSCVSDPDAIPGPAFSVTPNESLQIARTYTKMKWSPTKANILHGSNDKGIIVHTPDKGLTFPAASKGWWVAGAQNQGMPYKWGSFDTPTSFKTKIWMGLAAGDISTKQKRALLEDAVTDEAAGIDCSGFISRCWRLNRAYSTRELAHICEPLGSYADLQAGDILNIHNQHVLLFSHWIVKGKRLAIYEAGPFPTWKVSQNNAGADFLKKQGYLPYRYKNMKKPAVEKLP